MSASPIRQVSHSQNAYSRLKGGDSLALGILEQGKVKREEVSDEDIRAICEIVTHPETLKYCPMYYDAPSFETCVKRSTEMLDKDVWNDNNFCLMAKLDGKVVGYASVSRCDAQYENHAGAIEVHVHPDQRRKGIGLSLLQTGVRLAKERGYKRLEWNVLVENEANRKLLEKGGFQFEGIKGKSVKMHDELRDEALYAMLL